MTWWLLLALAGTVFFNRYLFLSPHSNIRLPLFVEKMLQYSAPCLLTAICVPIVFYQGEELRGFNNAYLYAALVCVAMAYLQVKIIYNVIISLLFFYLLRYVLGSI